MVCLDEMGPESAKSFPGTRVVTPAPTADRPAGRARQEADCHTALEEFRFKWPGVNWIMRVDGHTDPRPISTPQFPSNWELSTARAISVVKFLVERGVPADRLVAAGFGEYQPLDPTRNEDAFARNRRIEMKLDQR